MTLLNIEEIQRVASEWEYEKRIPAPRAARLLRELLGRIDELERGIGQMRLLARLPLPPDVVAALAEADRLRKLFDDAGHGEHNILALVDHYQSMAMDANERAAKAERRAQKAEEVVMLARQLGSYAWEDRLDDSKVSDDAKEDARELGTAVFLYDRAANGES